MLDLLRNWWRRAFDAFFELEKAPTPGERAFFRAFEWFLAVGLCWFAWSWCAAVLGPDGDAFSEWVRDTLGGGLSGRAIVVANAVAITLLLGLGLFRRGERFAYLAALPLIHFQFITPYWPDNGLHHSHLVGMMLLAIGLAFFLYRDEVHRLRFGLGMGYVFVGIAYTLAAMSKLRQSGLDWVSGENLIMWLKMNQVHRISKIEPSQFNALQEIVMDNSVLGTLILTPGLIVESLGLLFLSRRARPLIATFLLLMHLGIAGLMKIYFPWNMAVVLLLGYPWAKLIDRKQRAGLAEQPA